MFSIYISIIDVRDGSPSMKIFGINTFRVVKESKINDVLDKIWKCEFSTEITDLH